MGLCPVHCCGPGSGTVSKLNQYEVSVWSLVTAQETAGLKLKGGPFSQRLLVGARGVPWITGSTGTHKRNHLLFCHRSLNDKMLYVQVRDEASWMRVSI